MWSSLDRRDWLCVVVFVLTALAPYLPDVLAKRTLDPIHYGGGLDTNQIRGLILGGPWLDPNTGFTVQALGKLSADQWLHGQVPWWNSYTGIGVPLAAEMQTLSFFLPFVLLLHFAYGAILLKIALQIVAAIATYLFLRELKLVRVAAFCGAILYEFHGAFAWFAHAPIAPAPFLPLLLLGIERARRSAVERRTGGWVLIGIAIAYSLYAGFPEVAYLDGLLALGWTLVRIANDRTVWRLFAGKVAIGGIAGLLLAAPLVVPFLQYQSLSSILHTQAPDSGRNLSVSAALLTPYIFGPISIFTEPSGQLQDLWGGGGGYLDGTLLLLALYGLVNGKRDRPIRFFLAIWIAVFALRIFGLARIGYLLDLIPALNVAAVERYCETSMSMAAVVLAGYGLDQWRRHASPKRSTVLILCCLFVAAEIWCIWMGRHIAASLWHQPAIHHYGTWFWGSVGGGMVVALLVTVLWLCRPGRRISSAMATLITLNALFLFTVPTLSGYRYVKTDVGLVRFLQQHAGIERFYTFSPFAPNYGAYFGIASINHNLVPVPLSWIRYIHGKLDREVVDPLFIGRVPHHPMEDRFRAFQENIANYQELAVRYILAFKDISPFRTDVKPVYKGLVADVYELPGPERYFDVAGGACKMSNDGRSIVRASCKETATLVRKELYYPGWRVTVNGKTVPVGEQSIFQTAQLPKGESTVIFKYVPTHFGWLCVSAVAGFALLMIGFRRSPIHLTL